MRNKIEQEEQEKKDSEPKEEEESVSDRELIKTNSNFSFPIEFNDSDFVDTSTYSKQNVLAKEKEHEKEKKVAELYAKKEEPKPVRFKPTPIISPVYGVLDKNYKKEEVLEKEQSEYELKRPSRKVDFETVRKKAFGTLTDDLKDNLCENCELLKEVKITKKVEKIPEDNLLYDIVKDEEEQESEDISIATAAENYYDFGVDYEPKTTSKKVTETDDSDIKIIDHNEEEPVAEKIEVKENVEENEENLVTNYEKKENLDDSLELTDDLFNLIDSMYDEGDEK